MSADPIRVDVELESGVVKIPDLEAGHVYAVYLNGSPLCFVTIPLPKLERAERAPHVDDDFPCCSPGSPEHAHNAAPGLFMYPCGLHGIRRDEPAVVLHCRYCGGRLRAEARSFSHVESSAIVGAHPATPCERRTWAAEERPVGLDA